MCGKNNTFGDIPNLKPNHYMDFGAISGDQICVQGEILEPSFQGLLNLMVKVWKHCPQKGSDHWIVLLVKQTIL